MKGPALRFAVVASLPFSLWLGYRMGFNLAATITAHTVASVVVIAIELLPGLIRKFRKPKK